MGTSAGAAAHTPAPAVASASAPHFAAVSIRPWHRGDAILTPDKNYATTPERLRIVWAPFRNIVAFAYGVNPFQVIDGPDWFNRAGGTMYDLDATTSAPATRDEQRAMLRQALAERLGLTLIRENQPTKVYALVVGPGGPKLHALGPGAPATMFVTREPGFGTLHFPSTAYFIQYENSAGATKIFGRPLVDETGLTGQYDVAITMKLYPVPGGSGSRAHMRDLLGAVEPLGLEFKALTQPLPVYAVKSVHPPTAN